MQCGIARIRGDVISCLFKLRCRNIWVFVRQWPGVYGYMCNSNLMGRIMLSNLPNSQSGSSHGMSHMMPHPWWAPCPITVHETCSDCPCAAKHWNPWSIRTLIMQNIAVITLSHLKFTMGDWSPKSLAFHVVTLAPHALTLKTCMVNYA